MLIVPGQAGEIGVLARHAPLVATLKAGSTRVHLGGNEVLEFATGPGFFKVETDRALALVDDAVNVQGDRRRARARRSSRQPRPSSRSSTPGRARATAGSSSSGSSTPRTSSRLRPHDRLSLSAGAPARPRGVAPRAVAVAAAAAASRSWARSTSSSSVAMRSQRRARGLAACLDSNDARPAWPVVPRFVRRTAETRTALRNPSTRSAALMPHISARADSLGDRAGCERADERERLHEAPEHREDLAPAVVGDDLLDQRHVADEADAVADPEDDGADAPDREVRADGADRDTCRGDEERGPVAAVHRQAVDEPARRRRCRSGCPPAEKATKTPKPGLPAPYASVVSTISATLMPVYASVAQLQMRKIDDRWWSFRTSERPARTSRQCVRPIRAGTFDWSRSPIRRMQQRGDEEADRVECVDRARAEQDDPDAGEDRAQQRGEILGALDERVRRDERVPRDEVRDRRVAAGAEERGREARHRARARRSRRGSGRTGAPRRSPRRRDRRRPSSASGSSGRSAGRRRCRG